MTVTEKNFLTTKWCRNPKQGHQLTNNRHVSLKTDDWLVYMARLRIPVGIKIMALAIMYRLTLNAGTYFHWSKADEA
jgi:hypothetical protein